MMNNHTKMINFSVFRLDITFVATGFQSNAEL